MVRSRHAGDTHRHLDSLSFRSISGREACARRPGRRDGVLPVQPLRRDGLRGRHGDASGEPLRRGGAARCVFKAARAGCSGLGARGIPRAASFAAVGELHSFIKRLFAVISSSATQVPITMLLVHGQENDFGSLKASDDHASDSLQPATATRPREVEADKILVAKQPREEGRRPVAATGCLLAAATACALLAVTMCSDAVLQDFPADQCLPMILRAGRAAARELRIPGGEPIRGALRAVADALRGGCWASSVYSLPLLIQDLTPNIGQWWYFSAEVISLSLYTSGRLKISFLC